MSKLNEQFETELAQLDDEVQRLTGLLSAATARASELERALAKADQNLTALVAQRDTELAAMSRECEAWRKLAEWESTPGLSPRAHGVMFHDRTDTGIYSVDGARSDGTAEWGSGLTVQDAAIELARRLGLIAPDGKRE